ncbi:MAG TPA: FAD-dependent oxidoreductase [Polyangiaceae bacterium]|nr:FAD-dependent oxidoreductase [Polyangiaceae bacterium]
MRLRRRSVLKFLSVSAAGVAATGVAARRATAEQCDDGHRQVIERDVCVIGGGSSGTFSAVHVKDAGKSVVVVERKLRLGGHTETYVDPATGIPTDYGVVVFNDTPVVEQYFTRLGLTPFAISPSAFGGPTVNFDLRTGKPVTGFTPPTQAETGAALGAYFGILQTLKATYYDLDSGSNFPQPVPPDLLLPFGDFVIKYSLQAMVSTAFQFGQGLGNLLQMPTVYVLKNFSSAVLTSIFSDRFLIIPTGNSDIYAKATALLGSDALLGSEIKSIDRNANGVVVVVDTPQGRKEIRAKKLLITCPPTLENLRHMDLDRTEAGIFGQFQNNFYWTAILGLSGVPAGLTIANIGQDTLYNLPPLPGIYGLSPTQVPGLWNCKYGSGVRLSDLEVQRNIVNDVRRLHDPATFSTQPRVEEFVVFSAHNPFELRVSSHEIGGGFYTALNGLQGRNHTFYNGAAFQTHDSSLIWQYSHDTVLPLLLA